MTRLRLVCLLLLCTKYASGDCPDTETNVFRICQQPSSLFRGKSGSLFVSPDDVVRLVSCRCTIEGNTTNIFNLIRNKFDNANPFNYTINNGSQFLRYDEETKLLQFPSFNTKNITLALERKRNTSERNTNHRICFDFQVNNKEFVTIDCKASLIKEEDPLTQEKPASLGVILGSAFTVFILIDIAIFAGIYILVKRRILNTSLLRPRVTVTADKNDISCRRANTGNTYVGITPSSEYEPSEVNDVMGEYETAEPEPFKPPRPLLPGAKPKSWFQFKRSPKVKFSVAQHQPPDNEYEDFTQSPEVKAHQPVASFEPDSYENLSEPTKILKTQPGGQTDRLRQKPQVALKPSAKKAVKSVPKDDWVPADEYEEVEVSQVPREQYAKNPKGYADMSTTTKPSQGQTDSPGTKPTECYEEMEAASPINKLNMKTQAGSNVRTGSPNRNRSPKVKSPAANSVVKTPVKPVQGKVVPAVVPTEMYDNMEMFPARKERVPSDRGGDRQATPRRQRTRTEVHAPTQTYDNFDPIAEMRRIARAESLRKGTSRRDAGVNRE
ncbi:uncharacterized protein LOC124289082 [Haliotis rubra]|uniref:uncharacterized protein LOC124289082 n=1 Tax=Haliotis rubra TaxID=36100 RepID=UPI001EE5E0B9|nr:uncharacterized protein LOC124289082 [Haliotis rubra]